jgi:hypothetical protein
VGLLKPGPGFAAHDEVEDGIVVYVGSWWSDGDDAVSVTLIVAAVKDDGHGRAAAVGVGGGVEGSLGEAASDQLANEGLPEDGLASSGAQEAPVFVAPEGLTFYDVPATQVGVRQGGGVLVEDAGVSLVGGRDHGRGEQLGVVAIDRGRIRPGWREPRPGNTASLPRPRRPAHYS